MKKQPIYLYILGGLSVISMLSRLRTVFATPHIETTFQPSGDAKIDALAKSSLQFAEQTLSLNTDLVNKGLTIVMLILLIVVAVFLFKKWYEKAGWTYVGYLVVTLVSGLYNFLASRTILNGFGEESSRQVLGAGMTIGLGIQFLTFAIFLGITLFNLLRKPKEVTMDNSAGTI